MLYTWLSLATGNYSEFYLIVCHINHFVFRGFRFDDACWCGEAVSSLSGRNNHCSGNWRKENRACSCHQGRNVPVAVDLTPYNLDWRENNALIGGI